MVAFILVYIGGFKIRILLVKGIHQKHVASPPTFTMNYLDSSSPGTGIPLKILLPWWCQAWRNVVKMGSSSPSICQDRGIPKAIYPLLGCHRLESGLVWYHWPLHHSALASPAALPAAAASATACIQWSESSSSDMSSNDVKWSIYIRLCLVTVLNFTLAHTPKKKLKNMQNPIPFPSLHHTNFANASPSTSRPKVKLSIMKLLGVILYWKDRLTMNLMPHPPPTPNKNQKNINLTTGRLRWSLS